MNLAQVVSDSVNSVALVDLNFQAGPSDLSFYLDLPAEPNILHFRQGLGLEVSTKKKIAFLLCNSL